ncbi:glycoside hydrolase [Echria macrotheca]|uniref:Glycoside hydrolase n=1 Tax=Echria macrotheca TaxID=438768 RepID=A0AAJ0BL72_9PEZI|nr:glycoside hydrolase [Echria macrotheca]
MVWDLDHGLRPITLLVAAASLVAVARGAYPLTTDSNCGCYKTNATTSNYFAHHHFFDFRSLSQYVNVTKPIGDFAANADASETSAYFRARSWVDVWDIQTWNNTGQISLNDTDVSDATVKMVNSPNNIFIERNTDSGAGYGATYLTMRTVRHDSFQSAAEFESRSAGYQFLSIRMMARTKGAPGAVTAMFTYRPPPTPRNMMLVQEADLEIRTRDPPVYVQYTNQPSWNSTSDISAATRNVSLPGGRRWSDWAMYRMDWTPGTSTWYVNGQFHSTISFQAPRDPAQVMFNSWSDGGSWSGPMAVNTEAYMQIQWIELVYNNTDPGNVKTGKCVNVCSIDETTRLGTPVLITGNGNGGGGQNPGIPPSNPAPAAPGACAAKKYDQCAGKNWNGCKACPAGTTCKFQNDYYSQCL